MNVHVVTCANRSLYRREIDAMHRLRHKHFVEEMGWTDLRSRAGLEIDDFDDGNAVYLLVCEGGEVLGSMRLLPSWRRCMLSEVFGHFLDVPCPSGPDVWEWTRYCPGLLSRPRNFPQIRACLLAAAVEFALSRGITKYMAFGEVKFLGQVEELGWSPQPLSLPKPVAEGTALAMGWKVSPSMLGETRQLFGLTSPVAIEAPAYTDDITMACHAKRFEALLPASEPILPARPAGAFASHRKAGQSIDLATSKPKGTA